MFEEFETFQFSFKLDFLVGDNILGDYLRIFRGLQSKILIFWAIVMFLSRRNDFNEKIDSKYNVIHV